MRPTRGEPGPGHGSQHSPTSRSTPRWRADPTTSRHAAASLWLNNGIPATEVAQRLGQDVAVLIKSYVNCIDGQKGEINHRITAALAVEHDQKTPPTTAAVDAAASQSRGPDPATADTVGSGRGEAAGRPS